MEKEEEIKKVYKFLLENFEELKKQNDKFNYDIESDLTLYKDILVLFKTKDERLKALIMLYTYNVRLDELNNWNLADLKKYIYDTEEEQYFKEYEKLFKIIEEGE